MSVTLLLGGARSGKSRRALTLAEAASESRTYIATAEPLDDEMASRIARHQSERGPGWSTVEAPLEIASVLNEVSRPGSVAVVDCLTLWLSNLMHHGRVVEDEIASLVSTFNQPGELILVSNEVGLGLVPQTPLGREFRDQQGLLNQRIAEACDRVEFMAAGLPLVLKG